jgi:dTDP-4-amino-4,6-dideoxygalactose transaminase
MNEERVRSKERFLVYGAPLIEEEEIEEVVETLRSGWIGTGPKVARFEKEFAEFKKSPFAIAVHSCTAALHLSLIAAELPPGSEVITTPLTFCATVNAIIHAGCTPVLADINPATMNIDPVCIEKVITGRTAAIVPVHFAGRPCEMDRIVQLADKYNLEIIEDCAHAAEARYHGKPTGTFGRFGCFSFYVTKNIITGEGGMVLTGDAEGAARIKRLALHGMSADAWDRFGDDGYKHYSVVESGFKYNMMDLQAAIGLHQIKRVNRHLKRRREIWEMYSAAFEDLPVEIPLKEEENTVHSLHLYTLCIDEKKTDCTRDEFLDRMTRQGIGVGVHYISIAEHPFYMEQFGWQTEDFPHAGKIGRQTASLPFGPGLSDNDISDVIEAVKRSLKVA